MKDLLLSLSISTIQHVDLCGMEKAATQEELVCLCLVVSNSVLNLKAAAGASYLWLKLKDVVLGCPEVYFLCMLRAAETKLQ